MKPVVLLKLYGVALVTFLALDLLWLGVVAQGFYQAQVGHLMRAQVLWPAALSFYALFLIGLLTFAVVPALRAGSVKKAMWLGALYGFITYQTYELTNLALLRDWPLPLVFVDIAWGTLLAAAVGGVTARVGRGRAT